MMSEQMEKIFAPLLEKKWRKTIGVLKNELGSKGRPCQSSCIGSYYGELFWYTYAHQSDGEYLYPGAAAAANYTLGCQPA